jgi:hypothetical protein
MMRRRLTGWSRFLMVYTPAVLGLFVVLAFLSTLFFENHPGG